MISLARNAITQSGGWILDVTLFSNVSVCFNFEIPEKNAGKLRAILTSLDLRLSEESPRDAAEADSEPPRETDIAGTLQITFIHNEPDLRIEVPRIPG